MQNAESAGIVKYQEFISPCYPGHSKSPMYHIDSCLWHGFITVFHLVVCYINHHHSSDIFQIGGTLVLSTNIIFVLAVPLLLLQRKPPKL